MARECPVKGKGKGDMKGGGKGVAKGGFKGAFKGKGGLKGEGGSKGGGGKGEGKGYGKGQLGVKGAGKGLGYQGQCWTCGRLGHKSAECNVYMVGDVEQGTDVDAVNGVDEEPWIVGSVTEAPKEGVWSKTKKVAREKVKFMQGYGGPMKISTACEEECCMKEESRKPMERTMEAWMPRRSEVTVRNKFTPLEVNAVDEDEEQDIAAVNDEGKEGLVRVTVDSGAARSVWPRRKKGVLRRKLDKKPKLAAANGSKIEVYGEAVLEFEENGKQCGMRFLDSDVKKPLVAVSAMGDEGNTVMFSKKWGSYIENDVTGERIRMERVGDTFEIVLKARRMKEGTRKEVRWAEDGGKKYEGMEIDASDEDEEMLKEMASRRGGSVVFRGEMP